MPEEYDFNRLQADAVRRAREMQSRARIPPRQPPPPEPPKPSPAPTPKPELSKPAEIIPPPQNGLLNSLLSDKERTIILALLILLSGEDGNHELLFALMFLLM